MYDMGSVIAVFIMALAIIILISWMFRGIVLWYFKINARIDNQEKTNLLLTKILENLKK